MSEQDWESGFGRSIVVFLNGDGIGDLDRRGERVRDDSFLLCFNAHDDDIDMTMPDQSYGAEWTVVVDTASGEVFAESGGGVVVGVVSGEHPTEVRPVAAGAAVTVAARSLVVLQRTGAPA
jgi:glycogen operon protein